MCCFFGGFGFGGFGGILGIIVVILAVLFVVKFGKDIFSGGAGKSTSSANKEET